MRRAAAALAVLFLAGCAGGPGLRPAPEWVFTPPAEDAAYMYFSGSGTSAEGDRVKAEDTARGALIGEIMRYLGVQVTSETTAVARASADSYASDIRRRITETSSGRIAGLSLADSWTETGRAGTTVHLLARFAKQDLEKEKARIAQVFAEQAEAVARPEREAQDREAEGRLYEAASRYIDAAVAAAGSGLDNARIKFERNIAAARAALERISLVKLNDNLSTDAGFAFAEPFRLKAAAGAGAGAPGVPNVALLAAYEEARKEGRQPRTAALVTGEDGIASFIHPVPDFVGTGSVTVSIDLSAVLGMLGRLSGDFRTGVAALEETAARKLAVFNLEVSSPARALAAVISVAWIDPDGVPGEGGDFADGILAALGQAGFRVSAVGLATGTLAGRPDGEVIGEAAARAPAGTARVVFGVARIDGTERDGAMTVAKGSATVKVADAASGRVLLAVSRTRSAPADSAKAAVVSVLRKLGEDVGREIANRLR